MPYFTWNENEQDSVIFNNICTWYINKRNAAYIHVTEVYSKRWICSMTALKGWLPRLEKKETRAGQLSVALLSLIDLTHEQIETQA